MADCDETHLKKIQNHYWQSTQGGKGENFGFTEITNISSGKVAEIFGQDDPIIYSLQKGCRVRIHCKIVVEGNVRSDVEEATNHIRKIYCVDSESNARNGHIAVADGGVSGLYEMTPKVMGIFTNKIEKNGLKTEKSSDTYSGIHSRLQYGGDWQNNIRNVNKRAIDNSGAGTSAGNGGGAATVRFTNWKKPEMVAFKEKNGIKTDKSSDPNSGDHIRMEHGGGGDWKNNIPNGNNRASDDRVPQSRSIGVGTCAGDIAGNDVGATTIRSVDSGTINNMPKSPEVVGLSTNDVECYNARKSAAFNRVNDNDPKSGDFNRGQYIGNWEEIKRYGNNRYFIAQRPRNSGAGQSGYWTNSTRNVSKPDYIDHGTQSRNIGGACADSDAAPATIRSPDSGTYNKISEPEIVGCSTNGNNHVSSDRGLQSRNIGAEAYPGNDAGSHNANRRASDERGTQSRYIGAEAYSGNDAGSHNANRRASDDRGPQSRNISTEAYAGNDGDSHNANRRASDERGPQSRSIGTEAYAGNDGGSHNANRRASDERGPQSRNIGTETYAGNDAGSHNANRRASDERGPQSRNIGAEAFAGNDAGSHNANRRASDERGPQSRNSGAEAFAGNDAGSHNANRRASDERGTQSRNSGAGAYAGDVAHKDAGTATICSTDSGAFSKTSKDKVIVGSSTNYNEGNQTKKSVAFEENKVKKVVEITDQISVDQSRQQSDGDCKNNSHNGKNHASSDRGRQSRNSGGGACAKNDAGSHNVNSRASDERGPESRNNGAGAYASDVARNDDGAATIRSTDSVAFNKKSKAPEVVGSSTNHNECKQPKKSVAFEEKKVNKAEEKTDQISADRSRKQNGGNLKNVVRNGNNRASSDRGPRNSGAAACAADVAGNNAGAATKRSTVSGNKRYCSDHGPQSSNSRAGGCAGGATIRSIDYDTFNKLTNNGKNTKDSAVSQENNARKGLVASGGVRQKEPSRDFGRNSYERSSKKSQSAETPLIDWDAFKKKSAEAHIAKWSKAPLLTKDFYNEKPEVASLSADDVDRMRIENNTKVSFDFEQKDGNKSEKIPNPIWTFEQCFGQYSDLMGELTKQGFKKPSPIQCQSWPILLKGIDMVGISQTGTGKTLAFLLPAMIHTEYQPKPRGQRGGPNVLVLAPTRELAIQIETEVKKYSFRKMKAACIYGGGDRNMQINNVKNGVEIIICTPGRLNDLVQAKVINLSTITFLILDEADRMLDMGFEPQIRKLLLDIRPDRQTVMTSATWPEGVRRLAKSYMNNHIQVFVGSLELAATHTVTQKIKIMSDDKEKYGAITKFIENMTDKDKAIVFCGRKGRADDLSSDLSNAGYMTACIHSNRDQHDREQALTDIKTGMIKLLIATDVASRGLDIDDITYVINYDLPRTIEEYVHRVGRTGRAGRTGISISYMTRNDWFIAQDLIKILEEAGQEVPVELRSMAERNAAYKKKRDNKFVGGNRRNGYNN